MPRDVQTRRGPGGAPVWAPADPHRAAAVRELCSQHAGRRGALLPILHGVVEEFGYVHDDDIPVLAEVLNLSRADVHGVVSFYHDFRRTPPATHRVALCRAEACQAVGAQALFESAQAGFDGRDDVEVTEVFCLGNCALGPSGQVDGKLYGRLTPERVDDLAGGWSS